MVLFAARVLATMLQRGPSVLRFGVKGGEPVFVRTALFTTRGGAKFGKQIFKTPTIKTGLTRQQQALAISEGSFRKAATSLSIEVALNVSEGDIIIANAIIGKTIRPLSRGKIQSVDDAGNAVIGQIRALAPGGASPDFQLLGAGLLSAVLPVVGPEVRTDIFSKLAGPSKLGRQATSVFELTQALAI